MQNALHDFGLLNTAFDSIKGSLYTLGDVRWEINCNPEETKLKNCGSRTNEISSHLERIYGVPMFYCDRYDSVDNYWLALNSRIGNETLNAAQIASMSSNSDYHTESQFWETTEFYFEDQLMYREPILKDMNDSIIKTIEQVMRTGNITLEPQRVSIYQNGILKPINKTETLSEDCKGFLIIGFIDKGTSCCDAQITIHQDGKSWTVPIPVQNQREVFWFAFTSECTYEVSPITSGTLLLLTYHIMEASTKLYRRCDYYTQEGTAGPPSLLLRNLSLDKICDALLEEHRFSLGLLLDMRYNDLPLQLSSLDGIDLVLLERLRSLAGFHFQICHVIFSSFIESNIDDASTKKRIYQFSQADYDYCVQKQIQRPFREISEYVNFYRVGSLGCPFRSNDILSNGTNNHEVTSLYSCVALIIHKPTWWTYCRLLWIGNLKNSPEDCLISLLPCEILRKISYYVYREIERPGMLYRLLPTKRKR